MTDTNVSPRKEREDDYHEVDPEGGDNILKVKADDPNATDEERKDKLKKLAGAIAHSLRQNGEVKIRCFGNACIGKAAKAIAIARGMVAVHGFDLFSIISFITADMGGSKKTGICFTAFTNETKPSSAE